MPLTILTTGITFMISGRVMCSRIVLLLCLFILPGISAGDALKIKDESHRPINLPAVVLQTSSPANMTAGKFMFDKSQLEKLLMPYKDIKKIKLSYNEKRYSMFLKKPKEYKGIIEYISPDTFSKEILSPERKKYIINQQQLVIYHKDSKYVLSLDDYPQLKQLKALFSGLLQADASELTRHYQYSISTLAENTDHHKQYLLTLKSSVSDPFTEQDQKISQHIEIIFKDDAIKKITMFGFGGEKTEMKLTKILLEKEQNN